MFENARALTEKECNEILNALMQKPIPLDKLFECAEAKVLKCDGPSGRKESNMKEIIIANNGLSAEEFAAAFSRVQDYTNHCYRSEDGNRILVHCDPARTYSVDAGRMVDGVQAAKLALRHYLKNYIDRLEIICKEG